MNMSDKKTESSEIFMPNKKKLQYFFVWFFCFVFLITFDQISKYISINSNAFEWLSSLSPVILKQNFKNYNFAFSLPIPSVLIYVIYIVIIFSLVRYVIGNYKLFSRTTCFAWILIFAGAFSNILERIYLGYVRDFIYLFHGIFNFADIFICLGILLILLSSNIKDHDL